MAETIFFRLLAQDDKGEVLEKVINGVRKSLAPDSLVFKVDPASFQQIPGSPFAYWVSESLRRKFQELPPFEGEGRTVKQGLATADDFRFVRAWWEVSPDSLLYVPVDEQAPASEEGIKAYQEACRAATYHGQRWVPFAKGGAYSPYYADLHLVVNWERDGEEIRNFVNPSTGRPYSRPQNIDFYFRPGLTYPRRLHKLAAYCLPSGAIISVRGSGIYSQDARSTLGIFCSNAFDFFTKVMLGRFNYPQFDNGTLCKTPFPIISDLDALQISQLVSNTINLRWQLASTHETTHAFIRPALLFVSGNTLRDRCISWEAEVVKVRDLLDFNQRTIDDLVYRLYEIEQADRRAIESFMAEKAGSTEEEQPIETEEEEDAAIATSPGELVADLVSYAVGCAFGRWDLSLATGERPRPELPDPFAPLPRYSPGMLVTPPDPGDGTVAFVPDGILVDDPDHPDDILRRVRGVLEALWGDTVEAVEREACQILGVTNLRDYFRNPRGFFDHHIKRYSKSKRKAPIYWLLQSPRKLYGVWLYYQRLDRDLLFKALNFYLEPKIRLEQSRLDELRNRMREAGTGGRAVKEIGKEVEKQEALLSDLLEFRDRLERVARLYLTPDLNDGVLLNIAPLWELVPWKEAKRCWEDLTAGKYEWSTVSRQLREKGLVRSGPKRNN